MPRRMMIERRETALQALAARLPLALYAAARRAGTEAFAGFPSLAALDPEGVVRRGYAVVFKDGKCVPEARALRAGDAIELHMRGGNVGAEVTDEKLHV